MESDIDHESEFSLINALMIYVLLRLFAFTWLSSKWTGFIPIFAVAPIVLGVWTFIVARYHWEMNREEISIPFRRLTFGDYLRWFLVVWIGWTPLATDFEFGFLLAAVVVVISTVCVLVIGGGEWYRTREISPVVSAMGFLAFTFLSLLLTGYRQHYGVPIIGHWLERPEYSTRYMVKAELVTKNSERRGEKMRLVAEIRVGGRSESFDDGEDRHGQTITRTEHYRDVWINRLYLTPNQAVTIKYQDEPLTLDESGYVTDTQGREWYVSLLNEPVQ